MARFVFLLGAHKSGTSLLRSLLDGHPALDVLPIESHFFQFSGWPILYPYKKQKGETFSAERFKSMALESILEYNSSRENTADASLEDKFDMTRLQDFFQVNCDRPDEELLLHYFSAIKTSLGCEPVDPSKIIVEKSIENAELAWAIRAFLPETRFIHIIRNPYSNIVSLRKFKTVNNAYPSLPEIIRCLEINYHFLELNSAHLDNYLIIRYEDLILQKTESLNKITSFLNIEMHPALNEPTILGKQWFGNSGTRIPLQSVDQRPLVHWDTEITPIETYYVNKYFGHILKKFGYNQMSVIGNPLQKNTGEAIKTYIRNRIYKIFE